MGRHTRTRDEHFAKDGSAKRILALDGGGVRGILTLGILERIEADLRDRHDDAELVLSDYFDLIAGTSTGAIIAAALAQGETVQTIVDNYHALGTRVFEASWLRRGVLRAKYDDGKLIEELQGFFGADTTLGGEQLATGLLIMTKRLDTGSPWPLGNNPNGKYFGSDDEGVIANGEYPLWQVIRASTAAPAFFDPQSITIAEQQGAEPVVGDFVDGAVSPFNNPALQALMYATLDGYQVGWDLGADKLLLVSVGTGAGAADVKGSGMAAVHAIKSLASLMNDCASLQETMLQWMSTSPTARVIDGELGDLAGDTLGPEPLLSYLRYNIVLTPEHVDPLQLDLDAEQVDMLRAMDDPANMPILYDIGKAVGARDVDAADFPRTFDLGS